MGSRGYFECAAGVSGDMAVAALLDVGADENELRRVLDSLPIEGFEIRIARVKKHGLDACDFDVILDEAHENHDHDMAYLHGSTVAHAHEHEHAYEHAHEHRTPGDVAAIIDASSATSGAKELAHRIFDIIAHAEAKAHGVSLDEVHFHEVGAVDSIVDVLAFAVCFDSLGVDGVIVTELAEGRGTVRCQHGVLPVPVPAVTNIVQEHCIPLRVTDVQGELVTPTGAAAMAAVRTLGKLPKRFVVKRVGVGAGKRDYATSGIVRFMIIEDDDDAVGDVRTGGQCVAPR